MRKTFIKPYDKTEINKSLAYVVTSYLLFVAHVLFQTFWGKYAIGILHDEAHDNNILIAMIINFVIGLTIMCLTIISLLHAHFYKKYISSEDRIKPLYFFSVTLAWSVALMNILFTILNVFYLLYIL